MHDIFFSSACGRLCRRSWTKKSSVQNKNFKNIAGSFLSLSTALHLISGRYQVWSDRRIYGAHVISGCLSSLDISLTTPSTPVPNALLPASTATSAPVTPTPTPPEVSETLICVIRLLIASQKKSKKRPLSTPGPSDGPDLEIPSLLSDEVRDRSLSSSFPFYIFGL